MLSTFQQAYDERLRGGTDQAAVAVDEVGHVLGCGQGGRGHGQRLRGGKTRSG